MKRFLCALLLAARPLADAVADGANTTNAWVTTQRSVNLAVMN
jgi:hypothetical protein